GALGALARWRVALRRGGAGARLVGVGARRPRGGVGEQVPGLAPPLRPPEVGGPRQRTLDGLPGPPFAVGVLLLPRRLLRLHPDGGPGGHAEQAQQRRDQRRRRRPPPGPLHRPPRPPARPAAPTGRARTGARPRNRRRSSASSRALA